MEAAYFAPVTIKEYYPLGWNHVAIGKDQQMQKHFSLFKLDYAQVSLQRVAVLKQILNIFQSYVKGSITVLVTQSNK